MQGFAVVTPEKGQARGQEDLCYNENYFTFEVLVPEFLMPYSPSCGGMEPCLNNLKGQTAP